MDDLLLYFGSVDGRYIVLAVPVALSSFAVRALRWQAILGAFRKIGYTDVYHVTMIGFMLNCVVPGRAGELARPALMKGNHDVPFSAGIATIAAERLLDLLAMLLLLTIVMAAAPLDPDLTITFGEHRLNSETITRIGGGIAKLSLLLSVAILLVSMQAFRRRAMGIASAMVGRIFGGSPRRARRLQRDLLLPLSEFLENFARGFSLVRAPKTLFLCFFYSGSVWLLQAFSYYILSLGCPGVALSYYQATAVMTIICFSVVLPSAPGFWGLWEAGGIFALSLFGITGSQAAGYTLVTHAVQLFPVMVAGFISAIVIGAGALNLRQLSAGKD